MIEDDIKRIKNLSEVESVIHEIDGAIFTRKSKEYLEKELKRFESILDKEYEKYNINISSVISNKKILLIKFEKIVKKLLDEIESLYANIIEKVQIIETDQNVLYIKISTLNYVKDKVDNVKADECEKVMATTKELNISINEIPKKIYEMTEKIKRYEEILDMCNYEIEICNFTRDEEMKKFLMEDINFETKIKLGFFNQKEKNNKIKVEIYNYFESYLNNFEENVIDPVINNISMYTISFNEKMQSEIIHM